MHISNACMVLQSAQAHASAATSIFLDIIIVCLIVRFKFAFTNTNAHEFHLILFEPVVNCIQVDAHVCRSFLILMTVCTDGSYLRQNHISKLIESAHAKSIFIFKCWTSIHSCISNICDICANSFSIYFSLSVCLPIFSVSASRADSFFFFKINCVKKWFQFDESLNDAKVKNENKQGEKSEDH